MKHVGTHALIVGGGVAGLFAATVASRFFEHVTVLDRDSEPEWVQPRKAVPQGQQFHALLPGGLEAAERWFPGFVDDLVEAGSLPFELGRDFTAWDPTGAVVQQLRLCARAARGRQVLHADTATARGVLPAPRRRDRQCHHPVRSVGSLTARR